MARRTYRRASWGRSVDGHVDSKDARWAIRCVPRHGFHRPMYYLFDLRKAGPENPSNGRPIIECSLLDPRCISHFRTQGIAKDRVELILREEQNRS